MADSKITALTSIGTATDPAVDPLVLVDVSDTSMAATGTTKKVTLNNLLASSPTAANAFTVSGLLTAASATITGDLTVRTNKLKVTSTGVGIGTATPGTDFQIGDGTGSPEFRFSGSNAANSGPYFTFYKGGSRTQIIAPESVIVGGGSTSDALMFYNASANSFKWNIGSSTPSMTLDSAGNLGLGVTPSAGGGVLQLKSGITFPATQVASSDANTLDDYEEGTWTPVVTAGSGTLTTVTGQTGSYTKIGRMVQIVFYFQITTNGTGASFVAVAGLPFTNNGTLASIAIGRRDGIDGKLMQGKISTGVATCNIWLYDNAYPGADGAQFPMVATYYV